MKRKNGFTELLNDLSDTELAELEQRLARNLRQVRRRRKNQSMTRLVRHPLWNNQWRN